MVPFSVLISLHLLSVFQLRDCVSFFNDPGYSFQDRIILSGNEFFLENEDQVIENTDKYDSVRILKDNIYESRIMQTYKLLLHQCYVYTPRRRASWDGWQRITKLMKLLKFGYNLNKQFINGDLILVKFVSLHEYPI